MQIREDETMMTRSGLRVRVIGVDSDPSVPVLTVRADNPDVLVSVDREDLYPVCLMDDGFHAAAAPGQDLCPPCQARMDEINREV